jgi:hypothetical protein
MLTELEDKCKHIVPTSAKLKASPEKRATRSLLRIEYKTASPL